MSKAIATFVNASFRTQRASLNQTPEDVPKDVVVTMNGMEKRIANVKKASWDQLRVRVTQAGNDRAGPSEADTFVATIVDWLSLSKGKHAQDEGAASSVAKKVKTANHQAELSMPSVTMIKEAGSDEETTGQYQIAPQSKNPMIAMMREFRDQMQLDQEQFRQQLRQDAQASLQQANEKIYEVAVAEQDTREALIQDKDFLEYAVKEVRTNKDLRDELFADDSFQETVILNCSEHFDTIMVEELKDKVEFQQKLIGNEEFQKKMVAELTDDLEFQQKLIADEDFQGNMVEVGMLDSVKVEMESMKKFHPCFKFQRGSTAYFDCVSDNVNRFIVEVMQQAGVDYDERKSLRQNIEEHVKKETEEATESEKDEEVAACGSEDEDETGSDESPLPPRTICDKPAEGSR